MADSLFDNRYRYDYIYPRGRSGETLRAVDTLDQDRPVVIKRPAPNDAPPIRAGQEVSILNERKALMRLAGHPVVTALLGSGQFLVGGTAHQYIVMERGQGMIVAELVRDLGGRGERLPELEMLVIVDALADLLHTAHSRDIVYNDVDAKHLFWDRETYQLKVIDWGNAVFLEGDDSTPQGISRQSDVLQVGELLYFIVSAGGRAEIPRDAGEDFLLNFGRYAEQTSPRLQAIISKAVHPNQRLRYKSMADLRRALIEYRDPLERDRNAIIGRVMERLRHNRSKDELQGLLDTLNPALAVDPGNPSARAAYREILARLFDLEVSADLDAARIYLESGNWSRAVDLLDDLRQRARGDTLTLIDLLIDIARYLFQARIQPHPPAALDAISLLFEYKNAAAAHLLLTTHVSDDATRGLYWLLAERIDAYTPDIMLLRPNLYRFDTALAQLAADSLPVKEPRAVLVEINTALDRISSPAAASLIELRDGYRAVVDGLTALATLLEPVQTRFGLTDQRLPLSALERAANAAMALADNMHVIGRQAAASPRDALHALDGSRAIDPTSAAWDAVGRMLDNLYELLGSYQTYVPAADGSDLEGWLASAREDLSPFQQRLYDDMLAGMITGLDVATQSWQGYGEATIQGNRIGAVTALTDAIDAVGTISPTLAGWLNQVRTIVTNAAYIERHALYGGLGRTLADGWEAFDRGRLPDAERLGQQACEIARSDAQRFAAERLRDLVVQARAWYERGMVYVGKATATTLGAVESLYTPEERAIREHFTAQMPSKETYLKAMGKGLVELYSRSSTAAPRILFFNCVLLGTLDAQEGALEDAEFWYEAASRVLGEGGGRHVLARALAEFTERRRDLLAGAAVLNAVHESAALPMLDAVRRRLEENPQAKLLAAGVFSLRELEGALRDWSDGEFRTAGLKLEHAINAIQEIETAAGVTLTQYRAWLMEVQAASAELHTQMRQMQSAVESRPERPAEVVRSAHRRMVDVTSRLLGDAYAGTLRGWRDTYESFLAVYADASIRRTEKLNRFNQLFRAMFIDRHPAYPLYRHWYDLTDAAPEFPAPPTNEPTPRITEGEDVSESEYRGSRYADSSDEAFPVRLRLSPRVLLMIVGGIMFLLVFAALGGLLNSGSPPEIAVTITETPTPNLTASQAALALQSVPATATPAPRDTLDPARVTLTLPAGDFVTPTLRPSVTALVDAVVSPLPVSSPTPTLTSTPSLTFTPSITPTPTNTPTPTASPSATLPPQGLQGEQDLLALFNATSGFTWNSEQFSLVSAIDSTYWRLGSNEVSDEALIRIALPASILESSFGNNAATRIRRMEVEMTLTTFNPALIGSSDVYFGALLQAGEDGAQSAGLQIQLLEPGVISLAQQAGAQTTTVSQRAVSVYVARLRLDRDLTNGSISVFFNGELIGTPISFVDADAALLPVLYVRNGGVIVSVTRWSVTLR
jgi:serine/threonine protein kinase